MKTAVSIPDRVFQSAEKLAARMGVSRSELYARAISSLCEKYREELVTEQLNKVYETELAASGVEPGVISIQFRSVAKDKW
jgi:metal-responsive CopG/Arc/MetJ family transcriptional regulator